MNTERFLTAALAVLCLYAPIAESGTIPGSMPRETLTYSTSLDRFSINTGFEVIRRNIDFGGGLGEMSLEAESAYVMVGCDVLSWLTAFGTIGATDAKVAGLGTTIATFDDAAAKWSLGANANLWRFDISDPRFLSGRLSLRTVAEVARYSADGPRTGIDWTEFSLALPFGYEMFADYGSHEPENMFSLAIYVGPGVSIMDGSSDLPLGKYDFDEKKSVGLVAGIDLYFSHNFSIGCHGLYADDGRVAGVVQYHF